MVTTSASALGELDSLRPARTPCYRGRAMSPQKSAVSEVAKSIKPSAVISVAFPLGTYCNVPNARAP